jgi:hypothetical protein
MIVPAFTRARSAACAVALAGLSMLPSGSAQAAGAKRPTHSHASYPTRHAEAAGRRERMSDRSLSEPPSLHACQGTTRSGTICRVERSRRQPGRQERLRGLLDKRCGRDLQARSG